MKRSAWMGLIAFVAMSAGGAAMAGTETIKVSRAEFDRVGNVGPMRVADEREARLPPISEHRMNWIDVPARKAEFTRRMFWIVLSGL